MRGALAGLALLVATCAAAQPVLRYEPPPGFYHSAITPPDDYSANGYNADVQVYPFRPFSGDIAQQFRRTLLREWIDPRYQEQNVAAAPEFRSINVNGATAAASARFVESVAGVPRQRMRMLIVAGNAAALVDASASSLETWQRALPALNAMAATFDVAAGLVASRDQISVLQ